MAESLTTVDTSCRVGPTGFVTAQQYDDERSLWADFSPVAERYTRWLNYNDPSHVYGL